MWCVDRIERLSKCRGFWIESGHNNVLPDRRTEAVQVSELKPKLNTTACYQRDNALNTTASNYRFLNTTWHWTEDNTESQLFSSDLSLNYLERFTQAVTSIDIIDSVNIYLCSMTIIWSCTPKTPLLQLHMANLEMDKILAFDIRTNSPVGHLFFLVEVPGRRSLKSDNNTLQIWILQ